MQRYYINYKDGVKIDRIKIPHVNHHAMQIQEMLNSYELLCNTKQHFCNQLESISCGNKELIRIIINLQLKSVLQGYESNTS